MSSVSSRFSSPLSGSVLRSRCAAFLSALVLAITVLLTPMSAEESPASPLPVMASFSIVADWVEQVGGERVRVSTVVPRGTDPHTFEPSPRQAAQIERSAVVFIIGAGLEPGVEALKARNEERFVTLIEVVEQAAAKDDDHGHEADHDDHGDHDQEAGHEGHEAHDDHRDSDEAGHSGHDHEHGDHSDHGHEDHEDHEAHGDHEAEPLGHDDHDHGGHGHEKEAAHGDHDHHEGDHDHEKEAAHDDHGHHGHHHDVDPHLWTSVRHARSAVALIRDRLQAIDPAGKDYYQQRWAAYDAQLEALDAELGAQLAQLPEARRRLVTTHDTLAYFAQDYQLQLVGSVLGSLHADVADPSPRRLAELVAAIHQAGVQVVFPESTVNDRLLQTVAREAGVRVGPVLTIDTLGPEGEATGHYVGMMRHLVEQVVGSLAAAP